MFTNIEDARKYGSSYSATSLVAYLNGKINHVTMGAYTDYIEGNEDQWSNLVYNIRLIIKDDDKEPEKCIHDIWKKERSSLYAPPEQDSNGTLCAYISYINDPGDETHHRDYIIVDTNYHHQNMSVKRQ